MTLIATKVGYCMTGVWGRRGRELCPRLLNLSSPYPHHPTQKYTERMWLVLIRFRRRAIFFSAEHRADFALALGLSNCAPLVSRYTSQR